MKKKKKKKKKREKEEQAHLTWFVGGEEDEWFWGDRRGSAAW